MTVSVQRIQLSDVVEAERTSKNDKIFIAFGYLKFIGLLAWALQGPPSPSSVSPQEVTIFIVQIMEVAEK